VTANNVQPRRSWSLRTRITVAMLLVAFGVLVVSYVLTYGLVRRSLEDNALSNLRHRSDDLTQIAQDTNLVTNARARRIALQLTDLRLVLVQPNGNVLGGTTPSSGLPAGISASDIRPTALLQGDEVSGRRGQTVYLAIPTDRTVGQSRVVVVATDAVDNSVLRKLFPLLLLAGLILLAVTVPVAAWLSRRLTRPINAIEGAARQLATGDLSARAAVPTKTDNELAALAATLNNMASQLEESRGSERAFLLSISHDLRTPLTSIRGYAEALADGTLDDAEPEDRKRAATVIGAESRRLERLVRDLLDLSRLDSRQFSLNPRDCDAAEVVRDAAEAFRPKAGDLAITLTVERGPSVPVVLDPERLGQIVANLVENALKYAAGNVRVSVGPYPPDNIALVVVDDGPGIPSDKLARVFDRLYTVRETPGRSVGTGLGLAIVRELAAAMGGTASAEVAADGGTRFIVTLPRTNETSQ
jgi:two-component system sensor histidine kinase BaeS